MNSKLVSSIKTSRWLKLLAVFAVGALPLFTPASRAGNPTDTPTRIYMTRNHFWLWNAGLSDYDHRVMVNHPDYDPVLQYHPYNFLFGFQNLTHFGFLWPYDTVAIYNYATGTYVSTTNSGGSGSQVISNLHGYDSWPGELELYRIERVDRRADCSIEFGDHVAFRTHGGGWYLSANGGGYVYSALRADVQSQPPGNWGDWFWENFTLMPDRPPYADGPGMSDEFETQPWW